MSLEIRDSGRIGTQVGLCCDLAWRRGFPNRKISNRHIFSASMASAMRPFDSARRDLLKLSSVSLAASAAAVLPAFAAASRKGAALPTTPSLFDVRAYGATGDGKMRSEERRVGKECRSRGSPDHKEK